MSIEVFGFGNNVFLNQLHFSKAWKHDSQEYSGPAILQSFILRPLSPDYETTCFGPKVLLFCVQSNIYFKDHLQYKTTFS